MQIVKAGTVDTGKQKKLVLGDLEDGNWKDERAKTEKAKTVKAEAKAWEAGMGSRDREAVDR